MSSVNPYPYREIEKNKETGLSKCAFKTTYKNDHGQASFVSYSWTKSDFSSVQNTVSNNATIVKTQIIFEWN